ncbi:hypothetical protein Tco_1523899 [Tanacetum coccineum]
MQTYNGKVRMWPTCDSDKSICDGGVKIYEELRAEFQNLGTVKHDSEKKKYERGGTIISDLLLIRYVKKALLKSWVIDCFKEALDPDKDPMERSFDDYKWVFDLEIEQLADEYELGIGKKGHILDMIWENYKNI